MTPAFLALALLAPAPAAPPVPPPAVPPPIDGMALSPHYEFPDLGLTFDRMVDEIAEIGATHVSVVVQWSQADVAATEIAPHPKETQDDKVVRAIVRRARAKGLAVMVFPILWVEKRELGQWRGTLKPADEDAWWRSYRRFVLHYADLAAEEGAALFSVGSELASLEHRADRWRALIAEVRARFPGRLLYSANWDHYEAVPFWGELDYIGLTGYYRLTEGHDPSQHELTQAWIGIRNRLTSWRQGIGRPLLFTELGYPSIEGAARSPWDYTGARPADPEAQRRCYEAFLQAWRDEPALAGVFFWNWWGPGGLQDTWYTLKGKPALEVVRRWYGRNKRELDAPVGVR